ncbi:hypothetical protein D3C73_1606970 [compost metagenome]
MIGDVQIGAVRSAVHLNYGDTLFGLKDMIIGRDHQDRHPEGTGDSNNFFFDRTGIPVHHDLPLPWLFPNHHQIPV